MKAFLALPLLILAACATTMSPEQMAQNTKDKNAVVGCTYGLGIYGQGGGVYVDTNRIADNQTVSVGEKCAVTVSGSKSQPSPAKLTPTPQ